MRRGSPAAPSQRAPGSLRDLALGSLHIFYWPGDEPAAQRALDELAQATLPGLPPRVAEWVGPITAYLAPDERTFREVARGTPEWTAGIALPEEGVLVVPARGSDVRVGEWRTVLRHEFAHVVLRRYLSARVPRWFDEGYAQLAAGSWDADAAWQLRFAFLLGRAPTLDSLSLELPDDARSARVAYLLAYTAVRHLYDMGGARGFSILLERWRTLGDLDAALRRTYGMTLAEFERLWRGSVRSRYGWLLVISQVAVLWAVIALLLLGLAAWVRWRRRRQRTELLAQEAAREAELAAQGPEPGEAPNLDPSSDRP